MKINRSITIKGLAFLMALTFSAQAAPMVLSPYALSGSSQTDGWSNTSLTAASNPGYGSFPGTGAWPSPIGSSSGGDASLNKIANGAGGGAYPAGGSIYFGGFSGDPNVNGATLAVTDSTPVADLSNIVFQIQIGEASTYDFFNGQLPALTLNGGSTVIQATNWSLLEQFDNGTVEMPTGTETIYINTYALQWDLSGVEDPITSFRISFTGVQHSQLYAMQLDQSDTYVEAVPEPSTYVLLALGGAALWALRRYRRTS